MKRVWRKKYFTATITDEIQLRIDHHTVSGGQASGVARRIAL